MSDYSFMKSGFNMVENTNNDFIKDATALTFNFMENAIQSASIYIKHAKRQDITTEDIKRSLMLELFLFGKRNDHFQKIKKIKETILKFDDEDCDEEEDDEFFVDNDKIQPFTISNCNCGMCKCLNNIYVRWETFIPKSNLEKHMKKYIDNMK